MPTNLRRPLPDSPGTATLQGTWDRSCDRSALFCTVCTFLLLPLPSHLLLISSPLIPAFSCPCLLAFSSSPLFLPSHLLLISSPQGWAYPCAAYSTMPCPDFEIGCRSWQGFGSTLAFGLFRNSVLFSSGTRFPFNNAFLSTRYFPLSSPTLCVQIN